VAKLENTVAKLENTMAKLENTVAKLVADKAGEEQASAAAERIQTLEVAIARLEQRRTSA
jgi:exonuclease VII small subunit